LMRQKVKKWCHGHVDMYGTSRAKGVIQ